MCVFRILIKITYLLTYLLTYLHHDMLFASEYNAAMDQHYNGNPVEGPAVVRFVAPFDDPYNPGFYA